MRDQGWGKIVNLSSMGGRLTFPGGGIYHATKYAVEAISDAMRFEVRGFGVDVIIIEPGLIVTRFGETAAGSVAEAASDQTGGDGAYGDFNRHVAKLTAEAYQGPMVKLGGGPEKVAETIAGALAARRPRPRYAVTPSAHLMINQRRITPDRVWDLMMRAQFPTPKR
jgi:NAD(P)-dependent dehydrogenase (short-subunit alcohol dehydrogenase family)